MGKRSRGTSRWRALAIYYCLLGAILTFQSIRTKEAERTACLTSQGLANTLLFVPCEFVLRGRPAARLALRFRRPMAARHR